MKRQIMTRTLALLLAVLVLAPGAALAGGADESGPFSGTCGDALSWTLTEDGLLTISGTGEIWDYYLFAPWSRWGVPIPVRTVVIGEGVTRIGYGAFNGLKEMTSVTIPDSVTDIGGGAFSGCSALTSVTVPAGVTRLNVGVFGGCSSLVSVELPEGMESIGFGAFSKCGSLVSITLPGSVTEIGGYAFSECERLTSITLPEGLTDIGMDAFSYCASLASIELPGSLTRMGSAAFSHCASLASITIPAGMTDIPEYAFEGCTSLRTVTIPGTVTSIGRWAFNCGQAGRYYFDGEKWVFNFFGYLGDVYYDGTEEQWEAIFVDAGNGPLLNATIHFEKSGTISTPPDPSAEMKLLYLTLSEDGTTATARGDFENLFARVALTLTDGSASGLYVTQAPILPDGTIPLPSPALPGLTVTGVNVCLVPTLADILSPDPDWRAVYYRALPSQSSTEM